MPYPNEHAARLNDPDKYDKIRRENDYFYLESKDKKDEGIDVIWGIRYDKKEKKDVTEIQALRFRTDFFTDEQAKSWLKEHSQFKVILFEKAKPKPDEENKNLHKGENKMPDDKNAQSSEKDSKKNSDVLDPEIVKTAKKNDSEKVEKVVHYLHNPNYSKIVHTLAKQVLTGESTLKELMQAVTITDEVKTQQEKDDIIAKTEKLPETPPHAIPPGKEALSEDGILRTPEDVKAAIERVKNNR